jgi:hypothetical protein
MGGRKAINRILNFYKTKGEWVIGRMGNHFKKKWIAWTNRETHLDTGIRYFLPCWGFLDSHLGFDYSWTDFGREPNPIKTL